MSVPAELGRALARKPPADAEQQAAERWPWLPREECARVARECARLAGALELSPEAARCVARLSPAQADAALAARWPGRPAAERSLAARECRARWAPWAAEVEPGTGLLRLTPPAGTAGDLASLRFRPPAGAHKWSASNLCDYLGVLGVDLPAGDLAAAAAAAHAALSAGSKK